MCNSNETIVTDDAREWAIYGCSHGSLHVALDRVMLTLTADEFHALQELMRRACLRLHGHPVTAPSGVRAHRSRSEAMKLVAAVGREP